MVRNDPAVDRLVGELLQKVRAIRNVDFFDAAIIVLHAIGRAVGWRSGELQTEPLPEVIKTTLAQVIPFATRQRSEPREC